MVFFTCNKCGESLKKKDVEKHSFTRCRGPPFLTCVDCLKDFREDYAKHTVCISEEARYSAKGLNGLKAQPKTKQQLWVETVHETIEEFLEGSESGVKPGVRQLMEYLKNHSTFPDKQKTFTNFIKNARRNEPQENIDFIWSLFEKARSNLQAKLAAERAAAEQAKRKAKEEKEVKEGKQNGGTADNSSSDSSDEDDDKKTKNEKLNKKMKQLTVNAPSGGNEEEPSTSTTETGLINELKSEKKKKKKKKSKGNHEEPEPANLAVDTALSMDVNDAGEKEKKKKKKRELSESESMINMNVSSCTQNSEKENKNKKKKKSNSVCEPPEVQDIAENDGTRNNTIEENDKENSQDSDKKLSKKEKKERKKREKYEAQLKEIESNKSNEDTDEGTDDNAVDEVTDDIERKKSKSKRNVVEQDPGIDCSHDVKEKETKKNKKRQREDEQISKVTTEDNHTNKKIKDNGVNGETQDGAGSLATEASAPREFRWDKTILQLLESQDGKEMSVKKLCKKVVNEYLSTLSEDAHIDDVKINSKFHKKLAKMHNVVVLKDKARIRTSRD